MYSENISAFLDFLRDVQSQYRIADSIASDAEGRTQDYLHQLELLEHTYHGYATISKELAQARKERRKAKDKMAAASPILEWIEANAQTMRNLEKLLGEVRKAERSQENRIYTPRAKKK